MESTTVALKWAQHKKLVFLTLEAKNLAEEGRVISLTPEGHLHFEGVNKVTSAKYKLELNLFEEVVVETTKWKVTDYCVQFSISKKVDSGAFWPRLTKEKAKFSNITVDWARWVDEDEADEKKLDYDEQDFGGLPEDEEEEEGEGEEEEEEDENVDLGDLDDDLIKKPEEEKKEVTPEVKEKAEEVKTE